MMSNIDKLKAMSTPVEEDWLKIAEEWDKEDIYLEKSTRIAVSVLSILRERHMTKKDLAERMGVTAQYVSKIVKGNENLTLETIAKLEMALDVELVNVIDQTHVHSTVYHAKYEGWNNIFSDSYCLGLNVPQINGISYLQYHQCGRTNVVLG